MASEVEVSHSNSPLNIVSIGKILSPISDVLAKIILPGIPVLYVLGRIYDESYWSGLGLSESLINYSVEDRLYWGFFVIFVGLADILDFTPGGPGGLALLVSVMVAVLGLLYFFIKKWLVPAIKARASRALEKAIQWRARSPGEWAGHVRAVAVIWLFFQSFILSLLLLLLSLMIPLLVAIKSGESSAERVANKFDMSRPLEEVLSNPVASLKSSAQEGKLVLLLQCSEEWCAIWVDGNFSAVHRDDIERIDGCYQVGFTKNGVVQCDWARASITKNGG